MIFNAEEMELLRSVDHSHLYAALFDLFTMLEQAQRADEAHHSTTLIDTLTHLTGKLKKLTAKEFRTIDFGPASDPLPPHALYEIYD